METLQRENSVARAPSVEPRQPSVVPQVQTSRPPPPLARVDSKTNVPPPPQQRAAPPVPPPQQRPQFQTGGPVNNPPQVVPRPNTPAPRGGPPQPLAAQQFQGAPRVPLRPSGPPSVTQNIQQRAPQPLGPQPLGPQPIGAHPPRPQQLIGQGAPQRPPQGLQFGPRPSPQLGGVTTPDDSKSFLTQPSSVGPRPTSNQPPAPGPLPRQPSQSSIKSGDITSTVQNKPANLDNSSIFSDGTTKLQSGDDLFSATKSRSYSIAAPPGAPSPLKTEDERRKSISALGGKVDDIATKPPGLGLIQEGLEHMRSNDSIKTNTYDFKKRESESSNASPKMTDSIIGSLSKPEPKKRDDDDDVVLQNNFPPTKTSYPEIPTRMASTDKKDDSFELKPKSFSSVQHNIAPENKNISPNQNVFKDPPPKPEAKPLVANISELNKEPIKPPYQEQKPPTPVQKKPSELIESEQTRLTPRKAASAPKQRIKDGDNDSGVDESTQGQEMNGSPGSPKKASKLPTKEKSSGNLIPSLSRSSSKSATAKTPENPPPVEKKKIPMNKIQVGNAPSPNIKAVRSKIGSLGNTTYKPGGGKVKIENKKLDFQNVTPRIAAKNDAYVPGGGAKKISSAKLEWNAKSKIGSLQNTSYKPGGGDKKIETVKLDFKEKAKPKVASTVNITHKPGGGDIKIENQKLEVKAQSKIGSLDNIKHKPAGGDVKIFDDKEYIRQMTGCSPAPTDRSRTHSRQEDYMNISEWSDRPASRCLSARAPRTPRGGSPRRRPSLYYDEDVEKNNERNRTYRPVSARTPKSFRKPAFSVY